MSPLPWQLTSKKINASFCSHICIYDNTKKTAKAELRNAKLTIYIALDYIYFFTMEDKNSKDLCLHFDITDIGSAWLMCFRLAALQMFLPFPPQRPGRHARGEAHTTMETPASTAPHTQASLQHPRSRQPLASARFRLSCFRRVAHHLPSDRASRLLHAARVVRQLCLSNRSALPPSTYLCSSSSFVCSCCNQAFSPSFSSMICFLQIAVLTADITVRAWYSAFSVVWIYKTTHSSY